MPVVLVFMGVAAFVTGIVQLVIHNSISKSTSSSNILSEIGESKENFEKEIKTKLFLGTVSIIVYIQYSEQMKKKQHEEMLQSIGGGVAASTELSTAATIKVAKDAIAELQTEQGQGIGTTSETTAVNTQEKEYVETFPATQEQGSQIYDTPAGQIEGPLVNVFPWVQPEPKVYDTPDTHIDNPSINIFPEAKAKELEDSILRAKSKSKEKSVEDEETENSGTMLGENGTKVTSETTWENGKTERIDVENPSPGKRPGQIHYHEPNNTKWYFDVVKKIFYNPKTGELASKKIQKLLNDKDVINGINKALKFLGEGKLK